MKDINFIILPILFVLRLTAFAMPKLFQVIGRSYLGHGFKSRVMIGWVILFRYFWRSFGPFVLLMCTKVSRKPVMLLWNDLARYQTQKGCVI